MSERLSDVKNYIETIKVDLQFMLFSIEEIIKAACEKDNIPIYLTKTRIKSPESAFLKIKKDHGKTTLFNIEDYAGCRILCLFEQDIDRVHKYIFDTFSKYKNHQLQEIKVFNWEEFYDRIKPLAKENLIIRPKPKKSGYKSVHYILKHDNEKRYVEIQLRTLVQYVWGELEHHMAYKQGNVHQHIKNSFTLLSDQLGTIDKLLSNLKDIKEKERRMELFSRGMRGPTFYLCYETDILPKLFMDDEIAKKLYNEYEHYNKNINLKEKEVWLNKANILYNELEKLTYTRLGGNVDKREKANIIYWQNMEKAFLHFCAGELDEAMKIYELIKKDTTYPDRYVVNFRLGEVCFIKGEIEKALEYFDTSEDILMKGLNGTSTQSCNSNSKNRYDVKRKISTIYWLLGQDYIDITIEEILAAEELFYEIYGEQGTCNETCKRSDRRSLINSLCYYHLEKYIILSSVEPKPEDELEHERKCEEVYTKTHNYYEKLTTYLNDDDCTGNIYDTAAWFCYHTYLKSRRTDTGSLMHAKEYCRCSVEKEKQCGIKTHEPQLTIESHKRNNGCHLNKTSHKKPRHWYGYIQTTYDRAYLFT